MIRICQKSEIAECCTVIYRSKKKKMKNEGARRKRDWMIDARNEDELKSRADLPGWLSRRILDKFLSNPITESNERSVFTNIIIYKEMRLDI